MISGMDFSAAKPSAFELLCKRKKYFSRFAQLSSLRIVRVRLMFKLYRSIRTPVDVNYSKVLSSFCNSPATSILTKSSK